MSSDVIVIGAGHNGLVAACYLARAGLDVLVVEASPAVGGCTTTQALVAEAPDHLINPCAQDFCLIHASTAIADLALHQFGYREFPVDPQYVGVDPDGASFAIWRDPQRTADEIRRFSHRDAEAYLDLARTLDAAMDVVLPLLVTNPTRPSPSALGRAALGAARHPRRVAGLTSLLTTSAAEAIEGRFRHPLVRGALAVVAGTGAPITADGSGAILGFMGLLHRLGLTRPVGGTQALPDALVRCLTAAGGTVRTGAPVEGLLMLGGRVVGVRLRGGEELTARCVVSSVDPKTTLTRLLPAGVLPDHLAARAARIPTTNSNAAFMKVDVAFSGRLEVPRHQKWRDDDVDLRIPALLIGSFEEMCEAFDLAAAGILADPSPVAALMPTAADPTLAPAGMDSLYLWQGWVPFKPVGETWDTLADKAAQVIVKRTAEYYEGFESLEIGRFVEPWPKLAERTNTPDGNPYHVDMRPFRTGPLRPALGFAGYRTPVAGLHLTGAGTHPGAAVSGIPGQLAARTVLRALKP